MFTMLRTTISRKFSRHYRLYILFGILICLYVIGCQKKIPNLEFHAENPEHISAQDDDKGQLFFEIPAPKDSISLELSPESISFFNLQGELMGQIKITSKAIVFEGDVEACAKIYLDAISSFNGGPL